MSTPDLPELAARINAAHAAATGGVGDWRPPSRVLCDERDGKLWVGELQISAIDINGRLPNRTLFALEIFRWNYRLIRCRECRQWFIGPHSAVTCSDDCRDQRQRRHVAAANQRASESRASRRRDKCEHCGGTMASERSTRRYCSERCRQAGCRHGKQMLQP